MLGSLDALRYSLQLQLMAQSDYGLDHLLVSVTGLHIADKRAIDLENIGGQMAQIVE